MERRIEMYGKKVYGVEVSKYGLMKGYLDYRALSHIIGDCIRNNIIREATFGEWDIVAGDVRDMVFEDYIISKYGYEFLRDYTDELVFYNENIDVYVWSITHFGTSWDYVLTNVKLVMEGE